MKEYTDRDIQRIINGSPDEDLSITIKKPSGDFEQLSHWVYDVLQLDQIYCVPTNEFDTELFLKYALQLSMVFQNTVGVPVFEMSEVSKIVDLGDGTVKVGLKQSRLDGFSSQTFTRSLNYAISICQRALLTEPTDASISSLISYIENTVIPNIRILVGYSDATVPVIKGIGQRGIPFVCLGKGIYQCGTGSRQRRIMGSASDRDSFIGIDLSGDKYVASKVLKNIGMPTPKHHMVSNLQGAMECAELLGWPVVVKPVDGDRGEGVTIGVDNNETLEGAVTKALSYSTTKLVLIEEQVEGVCHRLFIANGEMVYAVKRNPISITGNGVDTIGHLVSSEHTKQVSLTPIWKRVTFPRFDYECIEHIEKLGLTGESIPSEGEVITLREIESTVDGGIDEDMTDLIHPDNVDLAIRATKLFGLDIAGVDIMGTDLSVPWYESDMVITDVNPSPTFCVADISRSYLPKFLDIYFKESCCIPIEYCDTIEAAFKKLEGSKTRTAVLNDDVVITSNGAQCYYKGTHEEQLRLLLLNPEIDNLVIVKEGTYDG